MKKLFFTLLFLLQISGLKTMDVGLCAGQSVECKDLITNPKSNKSSTNNDNSVDEKPSTIKSLDDYDREDDWNEFMQFLICYTPGMIYCLYAYLYKDYCQSTSLPSFLKDNIYGDIYKGHFIPEE
jgi:hypothetical protein